VAHLIGWLTLAGGSPSKVSHLPTPSLREKHSKSHVFKKVDRLVCLLKYSPYFCFMKQGSVKDQIVETASRLFYEQGYNATGINQIIAEAGVAKASLYLHFPSKEDLLAEYLITEAARTMDSLNKEVARHSTVQEKVMAMFDNLGRTIRKSEFQGCQFLNIVSELPANDKRIREIIQKQKNDIRQLFKSILKEAKKQDLADEFYLLFEAALIAGKVHQAEWTIKAAKNIAAKLI
jgi:AcrR family transcriptional regulator